MSVDKAIEYISLRRSVVNINTTFISDLIEWNNEYNINNKL